MRPTKPRVLLAQWLFDGEKRHVTAEGLYLELQRTRQSIARATVYNILHQFRDVGLLREVQLPAGPSFFDTHTDDHHHFLYEETGELEDVPADGIRLSDLPNLPAGQKLAGVDVMIRLRRQTATAKTAPKK